MAILSILTLETMLPIFWETIAAILSLWCVWLAAKNNVMNWPVAMLASVIYAYVFYQNRFYSETYLQIVFFAFQSYGWWFWSNFNPNKSEKTIQHMPSRFRIIIPIVFLVVFTIWLNVYLYFYPNAQQPYIDAFLTVLSITALWMQARRWLENWYLWILADLFYVPMFLIGNQYITSALYALFVVLATKGLLMWRQEMNLQE